MVDENEISEVEMERARAEYKKALAHVKKEREEEYGKAVKTIRNIHLVEKDKCQWLEFSEVLGEVGGEEVLKTRGFHSVSEEGENKVLDYYDFKDGMQKILTEYCEDNNLPYIGSVHEFLRKNINDGACLDLVIREKNGENCALYTVKCCEIVLACEIPTFFIDNSCERINDDLAKLEKQQNEREMAK